MKFLSLGNKEKLINYQLGELICCGHVKKGIIYDSDIDLAKKVLREEYKNHPLIHDNRTATEKKNGLPMVKSALTKFNDSSITIKA